MPHNVSSLSWRDVLAAFLAELSPATASAYGAALRRFYAWYLRRYGEDPVPQLLTDEEAREWREAMLDEGLRATTVNHRLAALRSLVRFAGGRLETRGVGTVPAPVEALTARDVGRLIAAIRAHQWGASWMAARNEALVALLVRAGLRIGEALNVDVRDVTLQARSGWVLVRWGKGGKERRIPLSAEARKALRAYLAMRPQVDTARLFISRRGRAWDARSAQRMLEDAGRRAGISQRVHPHLLRHTFATRFLERGGDLGTLQRLLGHTNVATTSRYLHPTAAQMQAMVEGM